MTRLILSIYDFLRNHCLAGWTLFIALTAALVISVLHLDYKEDISDFLPLDEENHTALSVYQDISGANNLYVIVNPKDTSQVDPERLVAGLEAFCSDVEASDSIGCIGSITKEIDMEQIMQVADEVYADLPIYLTEQDYSRIDSLLSIPGFIDRQVSEAKQMLMFPSSGLMTANLARDPLGLFAPVLSRLQSGGVGIAYETYDNHILSPDGKRAIGIIKSTFGANESENNSKLVSLLESSKNSVEAANPDLDIHIIGGPAIAVGNASQIKHDSVLAVVIAGLLILALLIYVFRNARNILLIIVSVGWGWLFAMGAIALFYDSVSIIVIGIASVILGIAVNYPLHLIDHLKDSEHPRVALKEIISPLVVGNVTTVGAFLCLVPLSAPALHDLGLFASLLLVGTIAFVLIFLPHVVKIRRKGAKSLPEPILIEKLAGITLENNKWMVWGIMVLTVVFGFFSFRTEFDSDMRNINYMSAEQRADMDYFSSLVSQRSDTEKLYVVTSGKDWEEALSESQSAARTVDSLVAEGMALRSNHVADFLLPLSGQSARIKRWKEFTSKHGAEISEGLQRAALRDGFSPDAFEDFQTLLGGRYDGKALQDDSPLLATVFAGNVSKDSGTGRHSVVQVLEVRPADMEAAKARFASNSEFGGQAFDVRSMNGSIANTLSDDFNYIGFACGCIVFIFLWISLGSVELAIVSFLPMAVSWIWILGIMGILGIKFNIVNVILATFIFGQGDDYTIFMTEGLSYEFAYRKRVLASYKNSIIVSALIMFIGIGTLIFAKHPALRSLGEVTVVGMLSVVLMAYLFPPLVFNWLVRKNGLTRYRPITLKKIVYTGFCASVFLSQLFAGYFLGFFLFVLTKPTPRKRMFMHKFACSCFRFDVKRMPGMRFSFSNPDNVDFDTPSVIICNHQSMLDPFYLMTLSPKVVIVGNDHVGRNRVTGRMLGWLNFIPVGQGIDGMIDKLRPLVEQGYSLVIFPEGERPANVSNHVKRFHKGAVQFAEALGLPLVPVYIHGLLQAMPKGSAFSNGGRIVMEVGTPIPVESLLRLGPTVKDRTQAVRKIYQAHYSQLCARQDTFANIVPVVFDKYRYKGGDVERRARRNLKQLSKHAGELRHLESGKPLLVLDYTGQGELALVLALMYSDRFVYVWQKDPEMRELLEGCIKDFVPNAQVIAESLVNDFVKAGCTLVEVRSSEKSTAGDDPAPLDLPAPALTLQC